MRDLSATDPLIDDLEALIEEATDDPVRLASVKARMRVRLGRAPLVATRDPSGDPAEADAEDLWDNLPL